MRTSSFLEQTILDSRSTFSRSEQDDQVWHSSVQQSHSLVPLCLELHELNLAGRAQKTSTIPSTLTYLRYCCNNWLACRRLLFVHRLLFFSSHRRWKSVPFSKNKKTTNNHEVCHSCIHSRGDSVYLLHWGIHSFTPPIKYSRVWKAEISK